MKYILGLAFSFEYYRPHPSHKPAMLRIFADDVLIDELTFTERIGRSEGYSTMDFSEKINDILIKDSHKFRETGWDYQTGRSLCKKVLLYEIDETVLGKNIRLEVTNNNNNYTNGFMTKYSYFVFDMVFLMPKKYFEDLELMAQDHNDLQDTRYEYKSPRAKSDVDFWEWPWHGRVYDPSRDSWNKDEFLFCEKGGSFTHSFPLSSYKDMKVISPKGFTKQLFDECFWLMNPMFLSYYVMGDLLNRYNEDQRDNHTQKTR
jgi:hypothetical protein